MKYIKTKNITSGINMDAIAPVPLALACAKNILVPPAYLNVITIIHNFMRDFKPFCFFS